MKLMMAMPLVHHMLDKGPEELQLHCLSWWMAVGRCFWAFSNRVEHRTGTGVIEAGTGKVLA